MEGERTRSGCAAAAAVRVTSHQATRCSAARATSGTQAGGRARPSRAHLVLPRLRGRLAVGGRAPIILDSIIKCRVITRYGALLPHPTGREGRGLIGMEGRKREETVVFAQMSAVPYAFVSREGEKVRMETRRRRSWREGTVTGLRGGNEKCVCVCVWGC